MLVDPKWLTQGLDYALRQVYRILQRGLTFEDNHSQVTIVVTSPIVPGETFTVNHNLGRVPQRWLANPEEPETVWEVDRANWNLQVLYLRCSGSATRMTLTVW